MYCTVKYQAMSALNSKTCNRVTEIHLSPWVALGSTQPLTEMSTREHFLGVKAAGA